VSPVGLGVPAFAASLRAGVGGVRKLRWSDERIRSVVAAECVDFGRPEAGTQVGAPDVDRLPRLVPMALAACREALGLAGLEVGEATSRRVGVILGTGGGGIDFTLDQADSMNHGKRPSVWAITNATHGNLAGELSIRLGCKGPSLCVSTGCASSSDALGLAMELLGSQRPGSPDAWVVVGADAHVRWETLLGMELMKVIAVREGASDAEAVTLSRPFSRTRCGYVLGEGAWAVVVERPAFARERGTKPRARALGYGATCDAFHRVRPSPDMVETVRAMHLAVEDAGWVPGDVEVIGYHGTSTVLNDVSETAAVKAAFGAHSLRLVGTSIKGAIGHPQGASGMASVVGLIACLSPDDGSGGVIPPTINLDEADPLCDLDYTPNAARASEATRVLVNCLAFGAKNSALAIEMVK